jgi:hypothetical protein
VMLSVVHILRRSRGWYERGVVARYIPAAQSGSRHSASRSSG